MTDGQDHVLSQADALTKKCNMGGNTKGYSYNLVRIDSMVVGSISSTSNTLKQGYNNFLWIDFCRSQ